MNQWTMNRIERKGLNPGTLHYQAKAPMNNRYFPLDGFNRFIYSFNKMKRILFSACVSCVFGPVVSTTSSFVAFLLDLLLVNFVCIPVQLMCEVVSLSWTKVLTSPKDLKLERFLHKNRSPIHGILINMHAKLWWLKVLKKTCLLWTGPWWGPPIVAPKLREWGLLMLQKSCDHHLRCRKHVESTRVWLWGISLVWINSLVEFLPLT